MYENTLYRELAGKIAAYKECLKTANTLWEGKHLEAIKKLQDMLPSGSGFDCGTKVDIDKSQENKLVFHTSFHHMNETGMYDGWTEHTITLRPSLIFGFTLSISGRNRNEIKDCMYDVFDMVLKSTVIAEHDGSYTVKQES